MDATTCQYCHVGTVSGAQNWCADCHARMGRHEPHPTPTPAARPAMDLRQFDGHTPGPWDISALQRYYVVGREVDGFSVIAAVAEWDDRDDLVRAFDNASANIRLIAAAPALLAEVAALRADLAQWRALDDTRQQTEKRLRAMLTDATTASDQWQRMCADVSAQLAAAGEREAKLREAGEMLAVLLRTVTGAYRGPDMQAKIDAWYAAAMLAAPAQGGAK